MKILGLNDEDRITVVNRVYTIPSTNSKIGGLNLLGYEMENHDMDVENQLRIHKLLRQTLNLAGIHNCCMHINIYIYMSSGQNYMLNLMPFTN